jgi:diadenosine tetraphosphate (Ap4A) HIT family hydrolase
MQINEKILAGSELICELNLSQVRLMKDGDNTWFLLIPMRENIVELIDLSKADQLLLWDEVEQVSHLIKENIPFDKLNIGTLGNMVPQLHMHIIARLKTDRAWPGAIWGTKAKADFDPAQVALWQKRISIGK